MSEIRYFSWFLVVIFLTGMVGPGTAAAASPVAIDTAALARQANGGTADTAAMMLSSQADSVLAIMRTSFMGSEGDSAEQALQTRAESTEEGSSEGRPQIPPISEVISFYKLFSSALVLVFVLFLTRFVTTVLTNFSERFSSYRLVIKRLVPVSKVLLWAVSLYFIIAGILQPPLETIITVSASVGIAVGFASQDILRNIFGGIMIILDRPFQVGDKIEIDGQYGEVLQIGLRSVRIVTEDDSVVTVPNAEIMNKAVSNANSSALDCQVVAELFLPRDADTEMVGRICRRAAQTSRYAFLRKPIFVHFTHVTVGPRDFLKVRLKAYVLDIRFEQELRSDMTTRSINELRRNNILTNGV